ncbi:MAG: S41 family peptidase, partial [Terracidiphilus sp.]
MTPRARRAIFALSIFFAVCAVAGTFVQRGVNAQSSQDESQLRDSLNTFSDVYAVVQQNYAEPITGDKADSALYDGAIPGMLQVLDPHSHFYDPKSYARLREDQRGHYYGVGMIIQQQNDDGKPKVFVVTPYEDTPSYRAGIHPGDQIVDVDNKSTDGWTSDQVAKALKGPKGTQVEVTMVRYGQPKPLVFNVTRDEIP